MRKTTLRRASARVATTSWCSKSGKARCAPPGRRASFTSRSCCPSRAGLARALKHLVETRTPLQGASDHLVSESLYLADPEGNGIELYRDRSRESWVWRDGLVDDGHGAAGCRRALGGRRAGRDSMDRPSCGDDARPRASSGGAHRPGRAVLLRSRRFRSDRPLRRPSVVRRGGGLPPSRGLQHVDRGGSAAGAGRCGGTRRSSSSGCEIGTRSRKALARARAAGAPVATGGVLRDPSGNAVRLAAR